MRGFQVTFFTQQDRHHVHTHLHEWLMAEAQKLGIRGSTAVMAAQGYDHTGRFHSAHFFELADQPIEVQMAMTEAQCEQLFAVLRQEQVQLFYVKCQVEFGHVGDINNSGDQQ